MVQRCMTQPSCSCQSLDGNLPETPLCASLHFMTAEKWDIDVINMSHKPFAKGTQQKAFCISEPSTYCSQTIPLVLCYNWPMWFQWTAIWGETLVLGDDLDAVPVAGVHADKRTVCLFGVTSYSLKIEKKAEQDLVTGNCRLTDSLCTMLSLSVTMRTKNSQREITAHPEEQKKTRTNGTDE